MGRGVMGSPSIPPTRTGRGAMLEPRGSPRSQHGPQLRWLCATGIQPPCPPTPQPQLQLQLLAVPTALAGAHGVTVAQHHSGRRRRRQAATAACNPLQSDNANPSSGCFTRVLGANIQTAPKQGACMATGQTRPARWPPSTVFLALSSPLLLLLSHIPLLQLQPLKTLFSQFTAVLSTHGKGQGVTPSPRSPQGAGRENPPSDEQVQTAESCLARGAQGRSKCIIMH